jgi:hypothetical protein
MYQKQHIILAGDINVFLGIAEMNSGHYNKPLTSDLL